MNILGRKPLAVGLTALSASSLLTGARATPLPDVLVRTQGGHDKASVMPLPTPTTNALSRRQDYSTWFTPPPGYNPYATPSAAPSEAPASAPAPAPAPPTAPATAPAPAPAGNGGGTGSAGPGFGAPSANANAGAASPWLAPDNVGSPYNSNILLIEGAQAGQYKYTNTFTNHARSAQTVFVWNKTGQDGQPNSGQDFSVSTPVSFTLEPGEAQVVAFDENTSVAWCASNDGTNIGHTWGEATFGNVVTGWSGYDVSAIAPAANNGGMTILNAASGNSVNNDNAWTAQGQNPAGHDVGVPAGPLNLLTTFS